MGTAYVVYIYLVDDDWGMFEYVVPLLWSLERGKVGLDIISWMDGTDGREYALSFLVFDDYLQRRIDLSIGYQYFKSYVLARLSSLTRGSWSITRAHGPVNEGSSVVGERSYWFSVG